MKLEYIGPKAIISQHGISFKDGKDDKYVYINNAVQIYNAINHNYEKGKIYHHNVEDTTYSSDEIIYQLKDEVEDFDLLINEELKGYNNYLQSQEDDVERRNNLNNDEKNAFINNLKLMREYRTQRFINKHVYERIIKAIVDTIVKNKLHEIQTPFNERFWHILQTIEGWLSKEHKINTSLTTVKEDDELIIILHINKIY